MKTQLQVQENTGIQLTSPISLVAPRNNNRNKIVASLINNSQSAYYTLTEADSHYTELTAHILADVEAQGYTMGSLKANLSEQESGRALGKALSKAKIETLVIDQADRLQDNPTDWITGLVSGLSAACHVVLSARALNASHWNKLIEGGSVKVIAEEDGAHLLDSTSGQLEVYALGRGEVWFEGRTVTCWDGPLTRRLFYFLLDRGPVSCLAIFEAFWPNLPIREATNVFHVTKRKMNETVGCDATDYTDRHYTISKTIRLHYDVRIFETALREAEAGQGQASMEAWQRAIHTYRHPFLFDETTAWIVERRRELREGYAQALIGVAREYQKGGNGQLALMHYLRAIRELPLREDLYLQVMRLYSDQNDKKTAIALYEQLRHRLTSQLGIAPTREIAQLATKLSK